MKRFVSEASRSMHSGAEWRPQIRRRTGPVGSWPNVPWGKRRSVRPRVTVSWPPWPFVLWSKCSEAAHPRSDRRPVAMSAALTKDPTLSRVSLTALCSCRAFLHPARPSVRPRALRRAVRRLSLNRTADACLRGIHQLRA